MYLFKFTILPCYILSIIFSLSSSSWLMIWMGMEMNLIMLIFIILMNSLSLMKTESAMKYFLIQSMGSLIFLITINSNMIFYSEKSTLYAWVPPLALMLKSGMAPFHFWTPQVVNKFSYESMFLFFTFQKVVPLFVIFSSWFWITTISCVVNIIVGTMGAINQSSLFKMLLFSSINNTGWMILSMNESLYFFILFFLNYAFLLYMMVKIVYDFEIKWLAQIKSYKMNVKLFYLSIIMSMSGYPPFMGFVPKWLVIKYLNKYYPMIILLSILLASYTLFFYLKSSMALLTKNAWSKKWFTKNELSTNLIMTLNLTGPMLFYVLN